MSGALPRQSGLQCGPSLKIRPASWRRGPRSVREKSSTLRNYAEEVVGELGGRVASDRFNDCGVSHGTPVPVAPKDKDFGAKAFVGKNFTLVLSDRAPLFTKRSVHPLRQIFVLSDLDQIVLIVE